MAAEAMPWPCGAEIEMGARTNVERSTAFCLASGGSFAIQTFTWSAGVPRRTPTLNSAQEASGSDFAVEYVNMSLTPANPCVTTRLCETLSAEVAPRYTWVIPCTQAPALPPHNSRFPGLGPSPPVQLRYFTDRKS